MFPASKRQCIDVPTNESMFPFRIGNYYVDFQFKFAGDASTRQNSVSIAFTQAGFKTCCSSNGDERSIAISIGSVENQTELVSEVRLLRYMVGLSHDQEVAEHAYQQHKNRHILGLFAENVLNSVSGSTDAVYRACTSTHSLNCEAWEDSIDEIIRTAVDHGGLQRHALESTFKMLSMENDTLMGACLHVFMHSTGVHFTKIQLRLPSEPAHTKLLLTLSPEATKFGRDSSTTPLIISPSVQAYLSYLRTSSLMYSRKNLLTLIIDPIVDDFWKTMRLDHGYIVSQSIYEPVCNALKFHIESGIFSDGNMIRIAPATFVPTQSLSLYFWGEPGCGKSSFVASFSRSFMHTLRRHIDPSISVHFVKQNLNLPQSELKKQLFSRPNNNDLSTMSIIQSRKEKLSQAKLSFVCLSLEEIPPPQQTSGNAIDTNVLFQTDTLTLVTQHFKKLGLDPSIITILTSNYNLDNNGLMILQDSLLVKNIKVIHMMAVEDDKRALAASFTAQRLVNKASIESGTMKCNIIGIESLQWGSGDMRPTLCRAREIGYFASILSRNAPKGIFGSLVVQVQLQPDATVPSAEHFMIRLNLFSAQLSGLVFLGKYINLLCSKNGFVNFASSSDEIQIEDSRIPVIMESISTAISDFNTKLYLRQMFMYLFAGVLAPAVVLTYSSEILKLLLYSVENCGPGIALIRGIDISICKVTRSLYDSPSSFNIRDAIRDARLKAKGTGSSLPSIVVIEVHTHTLQDQSLLRELLEDTPSMASFSTCSSATLKDYLLFCVLIKPSTPISPQILSRASIVL